MQKGMNKTTYVLFGVIAVLITVILVDKLKKTSSDEMTQTEQQVSVQPQIPIQKTAFMTSDQNIDFVSAAEKTVNAVVHIRTEIIRKSNTYEDFFGMFHEYLYGQTPQAQNRTQIGFGSGVVLSADGYIVTNNHVVEGADNIEVTFNDKHKRKAVVIGADPTTDLALIKVEAENLDFLTLGNSDEVKIGEWVLAVGNPFNLTSTVTAGIVSAKARNINILGDNSSIESFIQTDAAINRGNSGGALVNTNGELIGINAAIASHTGVYEGYSFAIPSNIVRKVVDDLLQYGELQRAYLGVVIREITAEFAEEKGFENMNGVYVAEISPNSGADDAGIEAGDIILSVNNNAVNSLSQLLESINQYRPGDMVTVKVLHNDQEKIFNVELRNQEGTTEVTKRSEERFFSDELGIYIEPVTAKEKNELGLNNGMKVVDIQDGIFKRGGINKGFIITKINGQNISTKQDFKSALSQKNNNKTRIEGLYPHGMKISFEFFD